MMNQKNQNAYILILTVLMLAGTTAVVTYIFHQGMMHVSFVATMIARQKAKLLALGGAQVALAQLSYRSQQDKKEEGADNSLDKTAAPQSKKTPQEVANKTLLEHILPAINRMQQYELKQEIDGVDGLLEICIMCEEGKINLNEIFDFKTQKFKGEGALSGDWKKMLQEVCKKIDSASGTQDSFAALVALYKKQGTQKFDDVTQLLTEKTFAVFKKNIFYDPPTHNNKVKKRPLYLTDIFTVHGNKNPVEAWLLSDSLLGLLEIKRAQPDEINARKQNVRNWLQNFKLMYDWKKDWALLLKPIYEKDLPSLPKGIESFFSSFFNPNTFSVRVHATVGGVMQQLFAIIERTGHSQNGEIVYVSKIKKLYWL